MTKDKKTLRREKVSHQQRQMRIYRIVIIVISAIVILSWVLSLVINV